MYFIKHKVSLDRPARERIGSFPLGETPVNVYLSAAAGTVGIKANGTTSGTFSSTGLAVTGVLTGTGTISPQQATTAGAPAYVKGAIYFDTTLNKLRVGGATAWETITSV
jgi:hypothetical protein